jgi:hypothetical protein
MRTFSWKDPLFFAGLAAGFVLAVVLGHEASGYSKPARFDRFYPGISPDSLYYPTYATLENLALSRWTPGKTLVIIGGNSVLNGVGQPVPELWSRRLQVLLGEEYVVVNLAFRGALPAEGGAVVAEALHRRGITLIYVANTSPGACDLPVGGTYEYLYWDAWFAGKLTPYAVRETALAAWTAGLDPAMREKHAELRRSSRLNHWLRFHDLWNHVGYRHFFTVWNVVTRHIAWQARARTIDHESQPEPLAQRFLAGQSVEMGIVRYFSASMMQPDGAGGWQKDPPAWQRLNEQINISFVPALRPRTLMLLSQNCPYYREQLTPAELARDTAAYLAAEGTWRDHGIRCVTAGADFQSVDFRDRCHLAPSGGAKLAALVAREIVNMKSLSHE